MNSSSLYSSYSLMNFSSNLNKFFLHLKLSTDNFCDIAHPYKLLICLYIDMKILCLSHNLSLTCCWILRDDVWPDTFHLWCYSLPLVACRCLSVIPAPLLSFSDIPAMLILIATKSMQDQACIFLCICFRSFRIHQPKVVYHSVQSPIFCILKSPRLFLYICKHHLWYLPLSDCCKILSCLLMMFRLIFAQLFMY